MRRIPMMLATAAAAASMLVSLPVSAAGFTDIEKGAYYEKPVEWAVEWEITSGTSATTFSPNDPCTRGQIVTFLYRVFAGEPVCTESSFLDVDEGDYYYDPVNWAVAAGVTSGKSEISFAPDDICTRAEAMTLLWNAVGSPADAPASPFADVPAGRFYYNAVNWAVSQEITSGVSSTQFAPDAECTRGQIMTFLYRTVESLENEEDSDDKPAAPEKPDTENPGGDSHIDEPSTEPSQPAPAADRETVTEQEAYNRITALKSQYPEGMRFTNNSKVIYTFSNNYRHTFAGCEGFAMLCSEAAFGRLDAVMQADASFPFEQIRTGDVVRIGNYHTFIVLENNGDSLTIAEGNFNRSIHWGRVVTREELERQGYTVRTRYNEQAPGSVQIDRQIQLNG